MMKCERKSIDPLGCRRRPSEAYCQLCTGREGERHYIQLVRGRYNQGRHSLWRFLIDSRSDLRIARVRELGGVRRCDNFRSDATDTSRWRSRARGLEAGLEGFLCPLEGIADSGRVEGMRHSLTLRGEEHYVMFSSEVERKLA